MEDVQNNLEHCKWSVGYHGEWAGDAGLTDAKFWADGRFREDKCILRFRNYTARGIGSILVMTDDGKGVDAETLDKLWNPVNTNC